MAKYGAVTWRQGSPERFLRKRAVPVALAARQHSSRKLQRFWRAVYEAQLTTHHLAASFIKTGVPAVQPPIGQLEVRPPVWITVTPLQNPAHHHPVLI